MFTSIGADNFNAEALTEQGPALLAFISPDYEYNEQTDVLAMVSKAYGKELKVYLLDDYAIGSCMKFGVEGSPAFIIFDGGKEKARMLGKANRETLSAFVSKTLQYIKEEGKIGESAHNRR